MYARDRVRPKLFDMDQEKISRLFADLRRESLATGSYPITLRHLESMIRMSEASAKMALREYVRADDIDLAISVTVGSFVSAQKMSIKKTLERVSGIWEHLLDIQLSFPDRVSENTSLKLVITKSCSPSCLVKLSRRKSICISCRNVTSRHQLPSRSPSLTSG